MGCDRDSENWASDCFHHRRRTATHDVSFWGAGVAASADTATEAVVEIGVGSHLRFTFAWPGEKAALERLEWALRSAFEAGQAAKAAEIRQALGLDGRR